MEKMHLLGTEKISKLIAQFAIPAIASLLIGGLTTVVGAILVGRGAGETALSGVTVNFPLSMVLIAFAMLSGRGGATLISIKLGEGKKKEAEKILGNSILMGFVFSVFLSLFGLLFVTPIVKAFGAASEMLPHAVSYARILIAGSFFQITFFSLNNIIRSEGNPGMALITSAIGFLLFCIICPVLVFVFKMGASGAAWATVTTQIVMTVWTFLYFRGKKSAIYLHFSNLTPGFKEMLSILKIGLAPFGMQLAGGAVLILVNNRVAVYGGVPALTAMGIAFSLYNLMMMPVVGTGHAIQPIVGFNTGASKYKRVKLTLDLALLSTTIFCCALFILIQIFSRSIMGLFLPGNEELIQLGSRGLRIYLLALPLVGLQTIGAIYFQSVGKLGEALFLGLLKQVFLFIPMVIFLPLAFQLDGIWLAGPMSDIGATFLTGLFIIFEYRILHAKHIALAKTAV